MTYYYDIYGWLSDTPIEGRSTDVAPMAAEGNLKPNFTGYKWILMEYSPQPIYVEPELTPIEKLEKQLADLQAQIDVLKQQQI